MKLLLCFVTVALAAQAGEFVVLSNGFRIHADSHFSDGPVVRLQTSQGVIEIQASSVAAFEQEEYRAPVAAPAVVPEEAPKVAPALNLTPQELVTRAALHVGLPPAIVHSIARAESGYREDALSPKGAIGLMQLMPKTAAELDVDPHDPAQNAEAGARYAFGQSTHDLTPQEAAELTAILPNPVRRSARVPSLQLRKLAGLYERRAGAHANFDFCLRGANRSRPD